MRVAITGGTGFVGSHAAALLRERGHEVVLLSRRLGVDVGDATSLGSALDGCEAVIHAAGINREIGDQTYAKVHVEGTRKVVAAARAAGVRKIVLVSFLRARPACGSGYHESKWAAEEIVRGSGLDYTVVRAGVMYGRGDHMLDHLSHALYTFPLFGLVGMREHDVRPTAIEDAARVLVAAIDDARLSMRTVALVGPESMPLGVAVKRVAAVLDRHPLFVRMPIAFHVVLAWIAERLMTVPLVSLAQVRILSEGVAEPALPCDALPADLQPTLPMSPDRIRAGLPPPGRFTMRDLRACATLR